MEVQTIARSREDFTRSNVLDIQKVTRNRDPLLHPFEKQIEYARALNATKLDRVFAKPFVHALSGHSDGIYRISCIRNNLVQFLSGSYDGEIRLWDLATTACVLSVPAHSGFVRGLCVEPNGEFFFSCGDDRLIKHWRLGISSLGNDDDGRKKKDQTVLPENVYVSDVPLTYMDHHWVEPRFATVINIWDTTRSDPIQSYTWGTDSLLTVKYNPAESSVLASTSSDRSIVLYDLRLASPIRKTVLRMRSNCLAWNPQEPMVFTVGNDDHNLYSFDMRNLSEPLLMHCDHVGPVMDVSYSPTGRELVSASYDKCLRIWRSTSGTSREVYYAKRMQRILCTHFTNDGKYVISGSEDTNLRVWKAEASESIGPIASRRERSEDYMGAIKKRFGHMEEIRRISHHRHVPREVYRERVVKRDMKNAKRRREDNRRKHARKDEDGNPDIDHKSARKRAMVGEVE